MLVYETGSDNDVYGEGFSDYKRHWNNELPKRARMGATPRSRKGRPFASPSRGTVTIRTRYRFLPSKNALFSIKFGLEPVSNTAAKIRRLRGSGPTEQDTT